LIDPTALTMTICQVKNHSVVLVSATVVRDSLGTYHADVLIPFGTKPGDYAARWLATGAAISSNGIKEDIFTILPLAF
jgi:hypothetical protein